jgi:PAS domain-containing protein
MMGAQTATAATGTAANADAWLAALSGLFTMPAGYRDEQVDRIAALETLRCGPAVLDELVRAGLPCSGPSGDERFDRYDLFNLSLATGTGTSLPERTIHYALRWMHGGPETWTQRLEWIFEIELHCPDPAGCGAAPFWSHAALLPQAVGGEMMEWQLDGRPGPPPEPIPGAQVQREGAGPLRFAGRLATAGTLMTLRSPRLRAIADEFLAAGYRWARMPEALQRDYERVLAAGVGPCISASLRLEREFRAAGYEAYTRRGWLLGMLDLAHAWVEVVDDDGITKPVDPIFTRLTEYSDAPHPGLGPACIGSRINRLLPAAIPADGQMTAHRCGGAYREPIRRTVIRRSEIR